MQLNLSDRIVLFSGLIFSKTRVLVLAFVVLLLLLSFLGLNAKALAPAVKDDGKPLPMATRFEGIPDLAGDLVLDLRPSLAAGVTAHPLKGRVADAATGDPLPGASVVMKTTGRGVVTDNNGLFVVSIPDDKPSVTLVVSFLGYEKKEVTVTRNKSFVDIRLSSSKTGLDEVVVTGYMQQKKRTVTGAMSSLKGKVIENMPVQSFDKAMQGRMAGVLVQGGSGVPGGPEKVVIRGQGSITAGTQPLYIVDGVEINASDGPSNLMASNPLSYLNPSDIESIEVLKDAAAASIYGAQAGNGVVLITTKGGKAGKTAFSVNYYHGITAPMPSIEVLSTQEYLQARMEALRHADPDRSGVDIRTAVLRQSQLPVDLTDAQIAALPSYNWQNEAFVTGNTDNASLAVSGGAGKTTFRLSSSLNKTDGNVIGNDFTRATAYLRLSHDVNKKLNIWGSVNLSMIKRHGSYRSWGSYAYFSSPQYTAPFMLPFIPIYLPDGSFNAPVGERFPGNYPYNAIQVTAVNTQKSVTRNLSAHLRLSYKILPGLEWQSRFQMYYRFYDTRWYIDPRTQEAFARKGYRSAVDQGSATFTTSHTLTYTKKFRGGHNFKGLLGVEYRNYHRERLQATGEGFPTYQFRTLQTASNILDATEDITGNKRAGAFTQLNYNYMSRYMLSAVLRYDGSSSFGSENRYGWFPAISVGWDAARENFFRSAHWIQQLKLRASYGATGNSSISYFAARSLYNASTGSYGGQPGLNMYQLGNPDLRWEKNVEANIGLDYSLFKRRVHGSFDVYHRRSADLLLSTPLPWTSGFENIYRNVGEVVNKGLEIQITTENIKSSEFNWTTGFNISFQHNEVTKLYNGVLEDGSTVKSLPGEPGIRIGYPLQTNFRNQYAGVNPATGRPMWWYGKDQISYNPGAQGGGSYTPYGRGSRLSKYYGGLTNTFTYNGIELGIFFQYDMGRELYNKSNEVWYETGASQRNTIQRAYDLRWTTPGQITAFPRPIDGGTEVLAAASNLASSRFLEDASYIRLKQLSLSYILPSQWLHKIKVSNAKIYLEAVNVYTWTKWTGYDPEFYIDDSNFTSNSGQIPQTSAYTIGIQLNF